MMAGLAPNIYAAASITLTAALLALILRFISRSMVRTKYWYDDWFSIVAFVLALGYCIDLFIWTAKYNLGQDLGPPGDPKDDHIREVSRLLLWVAEILYTLSLAFAKYSILALYWRLFQYTSIRIPIQLLHVAVTLWLGTKFFITVFQCSPVRFTWDKSIEGHCPINVSSFFTGTILCHCVMDIIILLLPVFVVGKMHLSLGKRVAVILIFHSGIIVVVASIFVIVEAWKYDQRTLQPTHDSALFSLWGAVEVNMSVFAGCLPMLKPIPRMLFPRIRGMSTETASTEHNAETRSTRHWRWSLPSRLWEPTASKTTNSSPHHLEQPIASSSGARESRSEPARGDRHVHAR